MVMILGVLAAVVVVSVVGLLGRGEKESYATDVKTIQTVVAAFYSDTHVYSNPNGWNESGDSISVHNQPIGNPTDPTVLDLYLGAVVDLNGYQVRPVMDAGEPDAYVADGNEPEATDSDILAAAIWMGLLTNRPGTGTNPDSKDNSSPLAGENGPYLNPLPDSCSPYNYSRATGTYTWIVGDYGRVYGVSKVNGVWYAGFNGRFP